MLLAKNTGAHQYNSKYIYIYREKRRFIEFILVSLIFIGPILGNFYPPEIYFIPHTSQIVLSSYNSSFPYSSAINRIMYPVFIYLYISNTQILAFLIKKKALVFAPVIIFLVSTIWSKYPETTLPRALRTLSFLSVGLYLFSRFSAKDFLRHITFLFGITAIINLFTMIVVPDYGMNVDLSGYQDAWRGAYNNKNAAGAAASLGILAAICSYNLRIMRLDIIIGVFILNTVLLIESRSATSIIATIACFGVYITYVARKSLLLMIFAIQASMCALLLIIARLLNSKSLEDAIGRSSTLTGRTNVWASVNKVISDRPLLGHGYGFWAADSRERNNIWFENGWMVPHAHSDLFDGILQVGYVGLFFIVLPLYYCLFRGLWRLFLKNVEDLLFPVLCVLNVIFREFTETVSLDPIIQLVIIYMVCECYILTKEIYTDGTIIV